MNYITSKKLIDLIKESYPEGTEPIVSFRVKGLVYYSTRTIEQGWEHRWNKKIKRDELEPYRGEVTE